MGGCVYLRVSRKLKKMEKLNFDINQLLRFLLSGAWAIICFYIVYPVEVENISEKNGTALVIVALVIGCIIYSVHRAVIYPNLFKFLCLILSIFRKMKWDFGFIIPFIPTNTEITENFARWERRGKEKSFSKSHIIEWGSQVHFLFCSAFASLCAILFSNSIGNYSIKGHCYLKIIFWILFSSGIINNIRLILYDLKAKEIESDSDSKASG